MIMSNSNCAEILETSSTFSSLGIDRDFVINADWSISYVVLCRVKFILAECKSRPAILVCPEVPSVPCVIVQLAMGTEWCVYPFTSGIDRVGTVAAEQSSAPRVASIAITTPAEQSVVHELPRQPTDCKCTCNPHHVPDFRSKAVRFVILRKNEGSFAGHGHRVEVKPKLVVHDTVRTVRVIGFDINVRMVGIVEAESIADQ